MGEIVAYYILEQIVGATICSKPIRDRELADSPSRGLDVVAVDSTKRTRLVLAEVKVSDEKRSPPRVVDAKKAVKDCLHNQHEEHLREPEKTLRKIWDLVRKARTRDILHLLAEVALHWDKHIHHPEEKATPVDIICFSLLLRSKNQYSENDFGLFRSAPEKLRSAEQYFCIVCTPVSVVDAVNAWRNAVNGGSIL